MIYTNDADRLENGNTAIRVGSFQTLVKIGMTKNRSDCYSAIVEVNPEGEIVWEYIPDEDIRKNTHISHEIIKKDFNGEDGYYFTDDVYHGVRFVNRESKDITWNWGIADINWTEVNSSWGEDHYFNHPEIKSWSHINHVDFHDYGLWEAMLVEIREFSLIVEVNFTQAMNRKKATADDIIWNWGYDHLACPHNPEYLDNGNIIVCDSGNHRILEVNYTSKEIEWEYYDKTLEFIRDCDVMDDGRYLIVDQDETRIYNRTSNSTDLVINYGGYEADFIEESETILISGDTHGMIKEYNMDGKVIWQWGIGMKPLLTVNISILIVYEIIAILSILTKPKQSTAKKMLIGFLILLIIGEVILIVFYRQINNAMLVRSICPNPDRHKSCCQ